MYRGNSKMRLCGLLQLALGLALARAYGELP
jgi:hypothetical protein